MRKMMMVVVALAVALGVSVAVAGPASAAATPGCLTYHEWRYSVGKGLTRAQVYHRTGVLGRRSGFTDWGDGTKNWRYDYRQCNRHGKPYPWSSYNTVTLTYSNYTYSWDYTRTIWHRPPVVTDKGFWFAP